jgi:hypothetical protein
MLKYDYVLKEVDNNSRGKYIKKKNTTLKANSIQKVN